MTTLVYCTQALTGRLAVGEANQTLPAAGWQIPATSLLPDGTTIGSTCDKDPGRRHWLIWDGGD